MHMQTGPPELFLMYLHSTHPLIPEDQHFRQKMYVGLYLPGGWVSTNKTMHMKLHICRIFCGAYTAAIRHVMDHMHLM